MSRKELLRFGGPALVMLGGMVLALSLFFSGTAAAYGHPDAMTPIRAVFFLAAGLALSLGGFRAVAGAWAGATEVLSWSSAAAGLLFIAATLRIWFFGERSSLEANPTAILACLAISALALLMRARFFRRPGKR